MRRPTSDPRRRARAHIARTVLAGALSLATTPASAETIYAERFGAADGPSIVLIPGLSCGGDVWRGTVEALAENYDLHVLTLAGFAGQPALTSDEPFLPRVRDAIAKYIKARQLTRPTLVGHSLGGFLAYWVASAYPDHVGAVVAVDGLPFLGALQDPEATPESHRAWAEQTRSMFAGLSTEQFRAQTELSLRTMIRNPKDIAWVAEMSGSSDPATVGQAMAEMMTLDLRDDLANITAPILLLGAFGGLPSEEMRQDMAARYRQQITAAPKAKLIETPTLHFVMLDRPDVFLTTLRSFLAEVQP